MGDISPNVFLREGKVFANSRDVAAYFEKEHKHVLEAVDNLLKNNMAEFSAMENWFVIQHDAHPTVPGRTVRSFDMTRDGFTLLAMGFTGAKALQFKLRYIEAFNRMEEALRQMQVLPPAAETELPLTDRRLWLDEVALCLRVHGRSAARKLWAASPLTQIAPDPLPAEPEVDMESARSCLDHLRNWGLKLDGMEYPVDNLVVLHSDDPRVVGLLRSNGIAVEPKGWDGYVAVATHGRAAPALAKRFVGTPWAMAWSAELAALPGALKHPSSVWFNRTSSRAVLLPITLFDENP